MSKRTALNEPYKGLVESMSIPVEIHERDGYKFASFGSAFPIHSCTPEQVSEYAIKTHHYCDLFTEQVLAPLEELVYVRLDDDTAEKVFINRSKRLLLVSSDGQLAQWRCAPTFESSNQFMAGTPIVNQLGQLVSLVTARKGNHYAVSTFEGDSGYFETPLPWEVLDPPAGAPIYGAQWFTSREELREHVASLGAPGVERVERVERVEGLQPRAVLHRAVKPRVVLVAGGGRQLAHVYLHGAAAQGVEYL